MAKNRRYRAHDSTGYFTPGRNNPSLRDVFVITNALEDWLASPPRPALQHVEPAFDDLVPSSTRLLEVEDRRQFRPGPRPSAPRAVARHLSQTKITNTFAPGAPIRAFAHPKSVPICIRRKVRREVLLALGKGGGGKRKPKYNQHSNVRC